MSQIKNIAKETFILLFIAYTLIIMLISLSFISKYYLHFEILALIIAFLGIAIISEKKDLRINKKLHIALFILSIILIFFFRFMPYINNQIPIGYDTGIYKYAIENGLRNSDFWVLSGVEPGFLYLMKPLSFLFSTQFILTYLFIFFNILLGLAIYLSTKEYGKLPALISLLVYSVSIIQFKVFTYMYYKNILALACLLFSVYFLKRENKLFFVIFSILIGIIHRPTFYIFGLAYLFYAFLSPIKHNQYKYNLKLMWKNIILGIIILLVTSIFYIGKFSPAITTMFSPVLSSFIEPGESPGTFINFRVYQFSTLAYLPFAVLGFFYLINHKKFNLLFFLTLITGIIVYFQFFFFNRFIIHLDIFLIILSGLGFSMLISYKKKLGIIIFIILFLSLAYTTFNQASTTSSGITQEQFNLIKQLENTENNSIILSISSEYSPWVLGYSNRKTLAPGLFDTNWSHNQWQDLWQGDANKTRELLLIYNTSIYLFAGNKPFNSPCFSLWKGEANKIFRYIC